MAEAFWVPLLQLWDPANATSLSLHDNEDVMSYPALRIGSHTLQSRLIVGTGKYDTFETMQESLALSGADCITVAVRRERLYDGRGKNILDFLDLKKLVILPNR